MKLKTHKATVKRVKLTKSAKVVRVKAAKSHLLSHKTDRTKTLIELSPADTARVKKMAPYL
ncbi:MAG: 50S ribosomal protein L35 [bacterium ADurb.Bin400]|nr:MAG: 50S ribosomal protein L35 [bacterium ADurb.Bin400]